MPDLWGAAAIAAKCGLYLGIMTAAGTVMAAKVFRLDRLRGLASGFAILGLCAAVVVFVLRAVNLTGDASGMTDPEMLGLLWSTLVGKALLLRVVGLCLVILGLFMGRVGQWVSVFGGILAIWSFNHVGHVSGRDTTLLDIALTLYLIAIALWIGILTPLRRLASAPDTFAAAADVGHRFGVVASVTVPMLIIIGGYMGYQLVGSLSALLSTGYGQALILTMLLVSGLLGLAVANKLQFIPALRSGDRAEAKQLSQSIAIEWLVIFAVLGTTAALTTHLTLPT